MKEDGHMFVRPRVIREKNKWKDEEFANWLERKNEEVETDRKINGEMRDMFSAFKLHKEK